MIVFSQARVMRDLKKVVDKNMHPSKGYAFYLISVIDRNKSGQFTCF